MACRLRKVLFLLVFIGSTVFASTSIAFQKNPDHIRQKPEPKVVTSLPQSYRFIVKLKKELAIQAEDSLTETNPEIKNESPKQMKAFFKKHKFRSLRPLYNGLVQWKKRTGKTEPDFVKSVRGKLHKRANPYQGKTQPPEISRTYIIEPDVNTAQDFRKMLEQLRKDPSFEYVEPDLVVTAQMIPNDPYYSSYGSWGQPSDDLYALKKLSVAAAWDLSTGNGVTVAVVDTGIDKTHPDIAANVWTNNDEIPDNHLDDDGNGYIDDTWGWDFANCDNNPTDDNGHGTHVAGTIAAVGNNGIGVIGVAPEAKVIAVKGLNNAGSGYISWLSDAIIYAANNGADVINNSWSGFGESQVIQDAVDYAYNLGLVVVAAAGNDYQNVQDYFPAGYQNVITVAASDQWNCNAGFSNWGYKIDVAAPGVDILSLRAAGTSGHPIVGENYMRADGTSMAAPHVSGLAALILSRHPGFSNEQVRQAIRLSAKDIYYQGFDTYTGYGLVNAADALNLNSVIESHIGEPISEAKVTGLTPITGSAQGPNFAYYTLEYGNGDAPTAWNLITQGNSPEDKGQLGIFDATTIPDGLYTIRLTAKNNSNPQQNFTDRVVVNVKYLAITEPAPPENPSTAQIYKPGTLLSISGTATGPSFQRYRLEWAEGLHPTQWFNTGFVLPNQGLSPVNEALIARWDSNVFPGRAGYYQIRLLVDNAGFTSESRTTIYLEPDLMPGQWPQWLNTAPDSKESVSVAKADNGQSSLVIALPHYSDSGMAGFNRYSIDGTLQYSTNYQTGFYHQAAIGDLDGNPGDETVVISNNSIRIIKPDNTFTEFSPVPWDLSSSPVMLQDLNGDGALEILALGEDYPNKNRYIYAWNAQGSILAGFPIQIRDYANLTSKVFFLVVDLNGDGRKEIVVKQCDMSRTAYLSIYQTDGALQNWPTTPPVFPNRSIHEMAAGDLDHDGQVELIFTVIGDNGNNQLYVLAADGSVKPGWPIDIDGWKTDLAIADMDRDGTDEIVFKDGNRIKIFNLDGAAFSSAWPYEDTFLEGFSVGDINGDSFPEILIFKNMYDEYQLFALDIKGEIMKTWNIVGINGEIPNYSGDPLIGDFDNNGKVDIAFAYGLTHYIGNGLYQCSHGAIMVYTLDSIYNPDWMDWPISMHDPQNTSVHLRQSSQPTLTGICLNETNFAVTAGSTQEIEVTGIYSDGSTRNLTNHSLFKLNDPSIATVDANGLIRGIVPGTTTLTVSFGSKTVTVPVVIEGTTLVGITLDATWYRIASGLTKNIVVTAIYSDNSTQDVTGASSYWIDNTGIATVDSTGLISGLFPGITGLTVNYEHQTINAIVEITEAVVTSVSLGQSAYTVEQDSKQYIEVRGNFSDNTTRIVGAAATYQVADPSIAMVDSDHCLVGLAPGTTLLTVGYQGKTATAQVTVEKGIISVSFDKSEYYVKAGLTADIGVNVTYTDNSMENVITTATYQFSAPDIAAIDNGKLKGLTTGYTIIIGSYKGRSFIATVYVDPPVITGIHFDSPSYSVTEGATKAFTVTAVYSDNRIQDITGAANYSSSDANIAAIDTKGVIKGLLLGNTTITAGYNGEITTAQVIVEQRYLMSIQTYGYTLLQGASIALTVIAAYSDGSAEYVEDLATYQSADSAIVSVDATGRITAQSIGSTIITITYGGKTTTASVQVVSQF